MPCLSREHSINVRISECGEPIGFIDPVIHQGGSGGPTQGDDAIGVDGFEVVILIKPVVLLLNVDLVGVEVDVTPPQPSKLSPSHPGVESQNDKSVPAVVLGDIEDPDHLLIR